MIAVMLPLTMSVLGAGVGLAQGPAEVDVPAAVAALKVAPVDLLVEEEAPPPADAVGPEAAEKEDPVAIDRLVAELPLPAACDAVPGPARRG